MNARYDRGKGGPQLIPLMPVRLYMALPTAPGKLDLIAYRLLTVSDRPDNPGRLIAALGDTPRTRLYCLLKQNASG